MFRKKIPLGYTILFLLSLTACHHSPKALHPHLDPPTEDRFIQSLPHPFPPLNQDEMHTDWGKEMYLGLGFAQQLELYQTVTCFKRALLFMNNMSSERAIQCNYSIFLAYYLGKKYQDALYAFDNGQLKGLGPDSPLAPQLLSMLYDSSSQSGNTAKSEKILSYTKIHFPCLAKQLLLSRALLQANISCLETMAVEEDVPNHLDLFLKTFKKKKKSVQGAEWLSAIVPGSGYFYVGQKQAGTTALLLNTLFIAAAWQLYHQRHIAAAIIVTGFEVGWYCGGIYGAGQEAKRYNERLYESMATPFLQQERLFPSLMLSYGF